MAQIQIKLSEKTCPERKTSSRAKVLWWKHDLRKLRQKANKDFHATYKTCQNDYCDTRTAFETAL